MASISQLTEEEGNFTRFFLLNFKVSPEIARRFFDGVFPRTHLAQIINNSMSAIMKLNKSKRINAAQLQILRGVPGTTWPSYFPPMTGTTPTSSKDFDLTMMICLLRNIGGLATPTNGWDRLPPPNEILPGADLATLKWYRNQLAHTTVSSMDNNAFALQWAQVDQALTSLNNGRRPHQVIEILSYDLDGEQAKTVLKANAAFVETWIKDDKTFCETVGSEVVYDKVKDCNCIVVTSKLGLEKTATIRHIALKFKLKGFEIVPVESPIDIIKYKTNKKQMFFIDDVLGKYSLSPTRLGEWERLNDKLMNCLNTQIGSKKILCTLRLQIALQKRFKNATTILNKEVINLEHESNVLSKKEKKIILLKHLRSITIEKNN